MGVRRLNHAVLRVTDVPRARAFWTAALGMEVVVEMPGAAFLRLPASGNHHDLGLFAGRGAPPPPGGIGLYHLAWEVERFDDLVDMRRRLLERGALVGESDHGASLSLYATDPDGIEFEVMWAVPREHWKPEDDSAVRPLDWDDAMRRWSGSASPTG